MTQNRIPIGLRGVLVIVGAALLAGCLVAFLDAVVFQAALARRLSALGAQREQPAGVTKALASRREAGESGLVGRIEIPRIRLTAMVVEGTSGRALRRGVGRVPGTAFPGEDGNVGLAGHRDTYFRGLRDLEPGDRIRIVTPDGAFTYAAESLLIVGPERGDLLAGRGYPSLTLVTCYPFYWVGPAPQRFVVLARKTGAREAGEPIALHERDAEAYPAR